MAQLPRVLPLPDWSPSVWPEDLQRLSEEWYAFLSGQTPIQKLEWRWSSGRYVTACVEYSQKLKMKYMNAEVSFSE